MQSDISITMTSSDEINLSNLAEDWLLLEKKAKGSFFLTWAWIGNWLQQVHLPFYVLKGTKGTELVTLSIVFKKNRNMLGFIPIEQWWINRTGQELYDQCWLEENDFLICASQPLLVRDAIIDFLKKQTAWRELILGMSHSNALNSLAAISPEKTVVLDDKGYRVNYAKIKKTYEGDVLSRNTRQKIRQSERLLSAQGELSFDVLVSESDKKNCLNDIAKLHIARWQKTSTPSGFKNSSFSKMLASLCCHESVEISCMKIDKKALAYLINFKHNNKIYFYLSALEPIANAKIKLGLLIQKKAVEYYKALGFEYYDFLAGDARYKNSLSNESYSQKMVCFYKPSLLHKIEKLLKSIKHKCLH